MSEGRTVVRVRSEKKKREKRGGRKGKERDY
jgi:hypothetical protein